VELNFGVGGGSFWSCGASCQRPRSFFWSQRSLILKAHSGYYSEGIEAHSAAVGDYSGAERLILWPWKHRGSFWSHGEIFRRHTVETHSGAKDYYFGGIEAHSAALGHYSRPQRFFLEPWA
jgi:hypothetical protein